MINIVLGSPKSGKTYKMKAKVANAGSNVFVIGDKYEWINLSNAVVFEDCLDFLEANIPNCSLIIIDKIRTEDYEKIEERLLNLSSLNLCTVYLCANDAESVSDTLYKNANSVYAGRMSPEEVAYLENTFGIKVDSLISNNTKYRFAVVSGKDKEEDDASLLARVITKSRVELQDVFKNRAEERWTVNFVFDFMLDKL